MVPCHDDRVNGCGYERYGVCFRLLEGTDRDGNGRCEYGHDEHDYAKNAREVNDPDENVLCGNDRHHDGDLHANDLNDHVHRASVHAHDARGRRRSCQ